MSENNTLSEYKKRIARVFSGSAKTYPHASFLEQEIGERLLSRLEIFKLSPKTILDLGGGTGQFIEELSKRYPKADILHLDLAEGMIKNRSYLTTSTTSSKYQVCADAEYLPFKTHSIDFIFSNCVFHWCFDLRILFKELQRVLAPEGLLLFSTLGPDTLNELKSCLELMNYPKAINNFTDMHIVGDLLLQSGFSDPVMDADHITLTYSSIQTAVQELKQNGSYFVLRENPKGLSPKSFFTQLSALYQQFKTLDGKFPVSFEVVYGHAFGTVVQKQKENLSNKEDLYRVTITR